MTKQHFLWLSISSLALLAAGQIVGSDREPGFSLSAFGGLLALFTWVLGAIKAAQLHRWGWMTGIILFGVFATFIYGIAGPVVPPSKGMTHL